MQASGTASRLMPLDTMAPHATMQSFPRRTFFRIAASCPSQQWSPMDSSRTLLIILPVSLSKTGCASVLYMSTPKEIMQSEPMLMEEWELNVRMDACSNEQRLPILTATSDTEPKFGCRWPIVMSRLVPMCNDSSMAIVHLFPASRIFNIPLEPLAILFMTIWLSCPSTCNRTYLSCPFAMLIVLLLVAAFHSSRREKYSRTACLTDFFGIKQQKKPDRIFDRLTPTPACPP